MPNRSLLAKIHIARKDLCLDEETYRSALEGQTGKRSSAVMTDAEIIRCLRHFEARGWAPKSKPKKYDDQKGDLYSASPVMKRKIEVMWHNIYRGNDEKKHLRQWLFGYFKISDVNMLDRRGAYEAVEALKNMTRRSADAKALADRPGETERRPPDFI